MKHSFTFLINTLTVVLFCSLHFSAFSQSCANYGVVRTTGIAYTSMGATGNVVPYWRGQIANQNDDNRSSPVPIGFDFWYLGVRYTTVNIDINGFIDFSTTSYDGNWPLNDPAPQPPGYATCAGNISYRENGNAFLHVPCGSGVPPNSYDGTYWALCAMYCDIWASNGTAAVANSIKYKTTGSAPNRIFSAEYFHMDDWASAAVSDYNFQINLHETTGAIDFQYGTMTQVAGAVPYSCGINGRILSNPPAASELLSQQADNSGTFSNTVTALHNAAPTSNSKITFTPPVPANTGTALTFTGVGNTGMTLNWVDWASNEVGYVIYISTDGLNYSFYTQTAANVTSYTATNLYGTTYWWQVYAVTEGCLSTAVTGVQATLPSGTFISVMSGNWSNGATWQAGTVPTNGDNVIIDNGHTVVMDGSFGCTNLTVGQGTSGTLLIGNSILNRTVSVLGDITVNPGAVFTPNPSFAATHIMNLTGNIVNNGTVNFLPNATSLLNVVCNRNGNQYFSGTGATNSFNKITLSLGSVITNTLEVTADNFSSPSNFLIMNNGTFKFSVPTNTVVLNIFTSVTTIPPTCGLWMNSPNSTMNAQSTLNYQGNLTCSAGIINVGNNADEALMSNGALLNITGGAINVSGRLDRPSYVAVTNLAISGGTLTVNTVGSTSATNAPFMMDITGSSFSMTGGSIVIKNEGGTGAQDWGYINTGCQTNYTVTGGTLQIGNAATAAGQTMQINSNIPIANLLVSTPNSPTGKLITSPLTVLHNVGINASGTLNANNVNMNVGGDFTNNGTFTPGTNTVAFNGSVAQQIAGTTTTTFNGLTMLSTSATGLTLNKPANMTGLLTLTSGRLFTTSTNILALTNTASSTSGSISSYVSGPMSKTGTTAFVFPTGYGNGTKWARIGIGAPSASQTFTAQYFAVPYANTTSMAVAPLPVLNNVSIMEYWTLDRNAAANATVSLYWEDAGWSGIYVCNNTDLRVAHWNGAAWENNNDAVTCTGTCAGVTSGTVTTNAVVTSFSPFTFGSLTFVNPLPIELLNFTASPCGNEVCLNWSTASENNNDYFTIEKSKDGINFEYVGKVNGAGNSASQRDYTSFDKTPYQGISYYRLKQTDFNGAFTYSNIEKVEFNSATDFSFSVFPNPSDGENITLEIFADKGQELVVQVFDYLGKEIVSKTISTETKGKNNFGLPLSSKLAAGVYLIKATSSQSISSKKIIIK